MVLFELYLIQCDNDETLARSVVPKWKPCLITNQGNAALLVEQDNSSTNLYDLAVHFVRNCLRIREGHPQEKNISFLITNAMAWQPDSTRRDQFDNVLRDLSPEKQQQIRAVVNLFIQDAAAGVDPNNTTNGNQNGQGGQTDEQGQGDQQSQGDGQSNVQQRQFGEHSLQPSFNEVKAIIGDGLARLNLLIQMYSNAPEEPKDIRKEDRNHYFTVCQPINKCLQNHFNNDKEAFLQKWPLTGGITRFSRVCCKGKPTSPLCSVI